MCVYVCACAQVCEIHSLGRRSDIEESAYTSDACLAYVAALWHTHSN